MKRIPHDHLTYLEAYPWFIEAIRQAKSARRRRIVVSLADFEDDPFALYTALWLAASEGIAVHLPPLRRPEPRRQPASK